MNVQVWKAIIIINGRKRLKQNKNEKKAHLCLFVDITPPRSTNNQFSRVKGNYVATEGNGIALIN